MRWLRIYTGFSDTENSSFKDAMEADIPIYDSSCSAYTQPSTGTHENIVYLVFFFGLGNWLS